MQWLGLCIQESGLTSRSAQTHDVRCLSSHGAFTQISGWTSLRNIFLHLGYCAWLRCEMCIVRAMGLGVGMLGYRLLARGLVTVPVASGFVLPQMLQAGWVPHRPQFLTVQHHLLVPFKRVMK